MFSLQDIVYTYSGNPILHLQNWSGEQGSHHLVLGVSGSGKTTLLHLMAGLLRPKQGNICVAEQPLHSLKTSELDRFRGKKVALVPQKLHLIQALSVFDNLRLAQYYAGWVANKNAIETVLTHLQLTPYTHRYPAQLSQGQAQRVAIARAVLKQPAIILADEPTSHLDDVHCEQVAHLLIEQAQLCKATLVIATHDARLKALFSQQLTLSVTKDGNA